MSEQDDISNPSTPPPTNTEPIVCGIVMPISACDGCSEQHWNDVKQIISESVNGCGFHASLVSDADDIGIIQRRIIQNLYENPIVVCDVSGKNPNVMFELGIRLAFDKPTIIVKDDKTSYSFDTSPIEHLEYPRDLRYSRIIDFKARLAEKVKSTFEKAKNDPNYSTFLKSFGAFTVAKIETKEVTQEQAKFEEIREALSYLIRRDSEREKTFEPPRLAGGGGGLGGGLSARAIAPSQLGARKRELQSFIVSVLEGISSDKSIQEMRGIQQDIVKQLASSIAVKRLKAGLNEIEEIVEFWLSFQEL